MSLDDIEATIRSRELISEAELLEMVAEIRALRALAYQAERYHVDCGHDSPGAVAQCDPICDAWKAWRGPRLEAPEVKP